MSLPKLNAALVRRAIVAVLLIAVIVLIWDAWRAVRGLNAMRDDSRRIAAHLATGDNAGAIAASRDLERHAAAAKSATGDPVWWLAGHIPFVGQNFQAVATAATVADAIGTHSMPTFLDLAEAVQHGDLKPVDGRFDPLAFQRRYPAVRQAADQVDGPANAMARVHASDLLPPLDSLIADFQTKVAQAKAAADAAADAFEVMPEMVGGNGPRDYLLLVQSPAELRSTGGLPGTWAHIHADNGRLTMDKTEDLSKISAASLPLTKDELALFGPKLGQDPRDINIDPDFPRVAQIAAAKFAAKGVAVSGVFAVDPQALAYVLSGTGPVPISAGLTMTADNAVALLMNQMYVMFPNRSDQIAFNDAAAKGAFHALVHGVGNEAMAIRGLAIAAMEHRVLAWSANPEVARVIGDGQLSGKLIGDDGATPHVGLFLNDDVQGKPDYYLQQSQLVRSLSCKAGVQTLELTAAYRSMMPVDAARMTPWIVGLGNMVPPGQIAIGAYLVAPFGGTIDHVEMGGNTYVASSSLEGRPVAPLYFVLKPGEIVTIKATVHTRKGQTGDGVFTWTPGMSTTTDPATFRSTC